VKSVTTERFRKCFEKLPRAVQEKARRSYRTWKDEPYHASLNYKQIHAIKPIYSVRIGFSYRALGVLSGETVVWFWIGSHEQYNNLLTQL